MLTDFRIVLHSPDIIAPVGVLHPVGFHLIKKDENVPLSNKPSSVYEVVNDCSQSPEDAGKCLAVPNLGNISDSRLRVSGTKKDGTFSICCWLTDDGNSLAGTNLNQMLLIYGLVVAYHNFSLDLEVHIGKSFYRCARRFRSCSAKN